MAASSDSQTLPHIIVMGVSGSGKSTVAVALEAAENAAILARSQYETGLIDFETLLLTENQLLSARNSLASSAVERASAFVRLTQALGGGWDGAPVDMNEGTPR